MAKKKYSLKSEAPYSKRAKKKKDKSFKTVHGVDFTKQEYKDYIRVLADKKKKTNTKNK